MMRVDTKLKWEGKALAASMREAARKGLWQAAEEILRAANQRVPLDTGVLQASGDTDVDGNELAAAIFYDTPYAVRLHEHPEYDFQGGREGKWLERTINERSNDILEGLAKGLRF